MYTLFIGNTTNNHLHLSLLSRSLLLTRYHTRLLSAGYGLESKKTSMADDVVARRFHCRPQRARLEKFAGVGVEGLAGEDRRHRCLSCEARSFSAETSSPASLLVLQVQTEQEQAMVSFTPTKKNSRITVTTIENEFVVVYLPLDACPCGCFSAAL